MTKYEVRYTAGEPSRRIVAVVDPAHNGVTATCYDALPDGYAVGFSSETQWAITRLLHGQWVVIRVVYAGGIPGNARLKHVNAMAAQAATRYMENK